MALIYVCKAPCKLTALQNRVGVFNKWARQRNNTENNKNIHHQSRTAPSMTVEHSTDIGLYVGNIKRYSWLKKGKQKGDHSSDDPPRFSCFMLTWCLPCFVWDLLGVVWFCCCRWGGGGGVLCLFSVCLLVFSQYLLLIPDMGFWKRASCSDAI